VGWTAYHNRQQQEGEAGSRKGVAVKKRTQHQRGYVYRKGNLWLVRYYDDVV
jgi:hypothetical protein